MNIYQNKLKEWFEKEKRENGLVDIKISVNPIIPFKTKEENIVDNEKIERICKSTLFALEQEALGNYTLWTDER